MNLEEVELRKKNLTLAVDKAKKYYSGGGTPDLELMCLDPLQFNIETRAWYHMEPSQR